MSNPARVLWLLAALGAGACRDDVSREQIDGSVAQQRAARLEALAGSDSIPLGQPVARWLLPVAMAEISGLALDSAGRLFAHDDERGRVFEIDPRRGALLGEFRVPAQDFEGITIVGQDFYLVTSNGKIYQFREGRRGDQVETTVHDLRLGEECEFEGIVFEPRDSTLVLPCKNIGGARETSLLMYRWRLGERGDTSAITRLAVDVRQLLVDHDWEAFEPTDITRDPASGHYLILAGRQQALVELTREGVIVNATPLPGGFAQAEGIAVTRDGLMIVASEAVNQPAVIAVFRRPQSAASDSTRAPVTPRSRSTRTRP